jgi:hypothetical protein
VTAIGDHAQPLAIGGVRPASIRVATDRARGRNLPMPLVRC